MRNHFSFLCILFFFLSFNQQTALAQEILFTASDPSNPPAISSDEYIELNWSIPKACLVDENGIQFTKVLVQVKAGGRIITSREYRNLDNLFLDDSFTAISGSFRDIRGPKSTTSYRLELEAVGGNNTVKTNCSGYTDTGQTTVLKEPTNLTVSQNHIEKIVINWTHNSDWIKSYYLRRAAVNNLESFINLPIDIPLLNKGSTYTYEDAYSFTSDKSINNGEEYTYTLIGASQAGEQFEFLVNGNGKTIPIQFNATDSDDATISNVNLTWNDISNYADEIKIYRDGQIISQFATNENVGQIVNTSFYDTDNNINTPDEEGIENCSTPTICALEGSVNASEDINNNTVTVGSAKLIIERQFTGTAKEDEDEVTSGQTSGVVGISQGVSAAKGKENQLMTSYIFSKPVCNQTISLWDIDRTDEMFIQAYNNNTPVEFTVDFNGSCLSIENGILKANGVDCEIQVNRNESHSAVITFSSCIDKIDISYYDQGAGNGGSYTVVFDDGCTLEPLTDLDNDGVIDYLEKLDFLDQDPAFGVIHNYEIRLFKDGEAIVADCDFGNILSNGEIFGKVLTTQGEIPVEGITLKLRVKQSDETTSKQTNRQGEFHFTNIKYGLLDTFVIEAEPLMRHSFSESKIIVLSKATPISSDNIFFDDFSYKNGFSTIKIDEFTLTPRATKDDLKIDWDVSPKQANIIVEIVRDGTTIYRSQNTGNNTDHLKSSFLDKTGAPGKQYAYTVKAYQITGSLLTDPDSTRLSQGSQESLSTFPSVVPVTKLNATPNPDIGYVLLTWTHRSNANDGFRIYRNGTLLTELPGYEESYRDESSIAGQEATYTITSFRNIEGLTTESVAVESETINYPLLIEPKIFKATAIVSSSSVNLFLLSTSPDEYNFTGYNVYREDESGQQELLVSVYKGGNINFTDFTGIPGKSYLYSIKSYLKLSDDKIVESESSFARPITYPSISPPESFGPFFDVAFNKLATFGFNWEYPKNDASIDGFILYVNEDIAFDTIPAHIRSHTAYSSDENYNNQILGDSQFRMSAYRLIEGQVVESELVQPSRTIALDNNDNRTIESNDNFTASTNLRTHVRLNWINETLANNLIYRDGQLIASLKSGIEAYNDYDALEGKTYFYEIESSLDDDKSIRLASFGSLANTKTIFGRVFNPTTRIGIPGVSVFASSTSWVENFNNVVAVTDSTGSYNVLDFPITIGQSITLRFEHPNITNDNNSIDVNIDDKSSYEVNYQNDFKAPTEENVVAKISAFTAVPNPITRQVKLQWNTDTDLYDGVEIRRGTDIIAFVPKGELNYYVDEMVAPGIRYTYFIKTFLNENKNTNLNEAACIDETNVNTLGSNVLQVLNVTIPKLLPVFDLKAYEDESNGDVILDWSHLYDNHSYYLVFRNDELLDTVHVGDRLSYIDNGFLPEENSRYTIIAGEIVGGEHFLSVPVDLTIITPQVARVTNVRVLAPSVPFEYQYDPPEALVEVSIEAFPGIFIPSFEAGKPIFQNYTQNHVEIHWDFPSDVRVLSGFNIYKGTALIATVDDSERMYIDFTGIPLDDTKYFVTTNVKTDAKVIVESERKAASYTRDFALDFTGGNSDPNGDYVEVPHNDVLNIANDDFTIQAWIYPTGENHKTIVCKGEGFSRQEIDYIFGIWETDAFPGNGRLGLYLYGEWKFTESRIPLNEWTHVAVSFDMTSQGPILAGEATFSINGEVDAVRQYMDYHVLAIGSTGPIYSDQNPLFISRQGYGRNAHNFVGQIDDLLIRNKALNIEDIQSSMVNATKPSDNIVLYYDFEPENPAINETTLVDKSSNTLNGILQNFDFNTVNSDYILRDGSLQEAFPVVSPPFNLFVEPNAQEGNVEIAFDYPTFDDEVKRINKFYISRDGEQIDRILIDDITNSRFEIKDLDGVYEEFYLYGVQAEKLENNEAYTSDPHNYWKRVQYPPLPAPTNFKGSVAKAFTVIDLTWDYPVRNRIDHFVLREDGVIVKDGTNTVKIDKNSRSYSHVITTPKMGGHTYTITAVHNFPEPTKKEFEAQSDPIQVATGIENTVQEITGNTNGVDQFGWSLEMTEDWLVIGAPLENQTGTVHIYRFSEPALSWVLWKVISGEHTNERFGHAVDIHENQMIIGAPNYDNSKGRIQIYEFENSDWMLKHEHTVPNQNLELGYAVSIEDNVAIASMPNWPNTSEQARPSDYSMYTVHKSDDDWEQVKLFNNSQFVFPEQFAFFDTYDKREGHSIDYDNQLLVYTRLKLGPDFIYNSFTMVAYRFNDGQWIKLPDFKGAERDLNGVSSYYEEGEVLYMNQYNINISKPGDNRSNVRSVYYPTSARILGVGSEDLEPNRRRAAYWYPTMNYAQVTAFPVIEHTLKSDDTGCNKIFGPQYIKVRQIIKGGEIDSDPKFTEIINRNYDRAELRNGKALDINLSYAVVGDPGLENLEYTIGDNIGKVDFYRLIGDNINDILATMKATDGLDEITVEWTIRDGLLGDYIFRIYRDNEYLYEETSKANEYSYIDKQDEGTAVAGKTYTYTVVPIRTGITCGNTGNDDGILYGTPLSDPGFAKAKGEISGQVVTRNGNVGIENVKVTVSAIVDGELVEESVTTLSDGTFTIKPLLFDPDGTKFGIQAELADLDFSKPDSVLVSGNRPTQSGVIIFNESSYVMTGRVGQFDAECGLAGRRVDYYEDYEDGTIIKQDSVFTDDEGVYNLIVNPFAQGLKSIRIQVDNIQYYPAEGEELSAENPGEPARHQFAVVDPQDADPNILEVSQTEAAAAIQIDPDGLKKVTTVDFTDNLLYPVTIDILNSCGNVIDNNSSYTIRITSDESCYVREEKTNSHGKLSLNLPALNFQFSVIGLAEDDPTPTAVRVSEYLDSKPIKLDLLDLHRAAGEEIPAYDKSIFTYHTKAVITNTSTAFTEYLCDDRNAAAIIKQDEKYSLSFSVSEDHGPSCLVNQGYLLIKNSGSINSKPDTLRYDLERNAFPRYRFTAGGPNLISPYEWTILVQYFSENNNLLSETVFPILVEGSRQLPGAGLSLDLGDENGEIQLPIMVLRDPPGDASSVTIEKGSRISSELSFNSSTSGGLGLIAEVAASFGGPGLFAEYEFIKGGGNERSNSVTVETELTESISTSDDNDFTGRQADVIVGVGLASSFGVLQGIRVNGCDDIQLFSEIGFSADGVSTEWNYTLGFIEGIINQLKTDSLNLRTGNLTFRYADGTPYSEEQAILKVSSELNAWYKILEYHDINSLPHYILCADESYRDELSESNRAELDKWRGAFCREIGVFEGQKFTLNDKITWDDDLINKYKNTAAAIESMKIGRDDFPVEFNANDWDEAQRTLTADYEANVDSLGHNPAKNKTLSGGVSKEFTYTNTRTATTDLGFSSYFSTSGAAGFYFNSELEVGLVFSNGVAGIEAKAGIQGEFETSYGSNRVAEDEQSTTVTVSLLDDDADDNFSVTIIPSPLANHGPYFALTGGQSSCPAEEALSSRDNAPIPIDNFEMVIEDPVSGAIGNTITKQNIPLDEIIILNLKVKNITNLNLNRVAELFAGNNFNNLRIFVEGDVLTSTNSPSIPVTGSEQRTISVAFERPAFSDRYSFENIKLNLKVFCDGEDTRSELESSTFVTVNLYYQQPCSQISIGAPENNFVINRVNNSIPDDRELLTFKLYDLDPDNENLDEVILEYKRLNQNSDWTEITRIDRDVIKDELDLFPLTETPFYLFNWDITGLYNQFPDGEYIVRAISKCKGSAGEIISKEIKGTISRSSIHAFGVPEPADGIWSTGDEISVVYSKDLDCGLINRPAELAKNFKLLNRSQNDEEIPFNLICTNGKISLIPISDLSSFDGETLVSVYKNVIDKNGNRADDIEWPFKVVTKQADWISQDIEVRLYQGEMTDKVAFIANGSGEQVTGLSLTKSAELPWLEVDTENFTLLKAGRGIPLTISGNQDPGIYEGQLSINGVTGVAPSINIKVTILRAPPNIETLQTGDNQMVITADWKFENEVPDIDSLDQIQVWLGDELRGFANMRVEGPFYAATIVVQGNEEDEGKLLNFRVWQGDSQIYYEAKSTSTIRFNKDSKVGSLDEPETLVVDVRDVISDNLQASSENRSIEVKTIESNPSIRLAPNPTTNLTTISLRSEIAEDSQINIYNSLGELVHHIDYKEILSSNREVIFDTNKLHGGIYQVVYSYSNKIDSKKLIVIK